MQLVLNRTYYADGVNGTLLIDGVPVCHTIELPWKDNRTGVSCIPEGVYALSKRYSDRFGQHLLLQGVPNRSLILVHAYNNALQESRGCIAPVSVLTGNGRGERSRAALQLIISKVYPVLAQGVPVFITIKS